MLKLFGIYGLITRVKVMEINFLDLFSRRERRKEINLSYNIEPLYFDGDKIETIEPIVVNGEIVSKEEELQFKANITTKLTLSCSRCLGTFIYPIDIDIEERFTNNKDLQNDEEIMFVDSDTFDITEIVENIIISTLPIKRLCTDNCKGLCHQCGKNLNIEECQCNNDEIDIRMAKLQELFKQ